MQPWQRVSDADRELATAALREHCAQGRLSYEELNDRLERALAARSRAELEMLTRDLPSLKQPAVRRLAKLPTPQVTPLFRVHASLYGMVNGFLVAIWAVSGAGEFWPVYPALSWGLGLGVHFVIAREVVRARTRRRARRQAAHRPSKAGPLRQWMTVMFTDVVDSTAFAERVGDERWSALLEDHRMLLRNSFRAHGGSEVSSGGDGFLARFPTPAAAVRCAIDIQKRLSELRRSRELVPEIRIGIHAGEVLQQADSDLIGRVVNLASRVTALSGPGEIIVTEPVADHVGDGFVFEDRGLHELKGIPRPRHLLAVSWRDG